MLQANAVDYDYDYDSKLQMLFGFELAHAL